MRQRGGRTLPFVFEKESEGFQGVRAPVPMGTTSMPTRRAAGIRCTRTMTCAASIIGSSTSRPMGHVQIRQSLFFSRLRRAEIGIHHHVSGDYLERYSSEMAWREDHRRTSNGEQSSMIAAMALRHSRSTQFAGYWQRSRSRAA